ncbi:MAG: hypothetical protein AAF502_06195 [Bacteroidota bacterium]
MLRGLLFVFTILYSGFLVGHPAWGIVLSPDGHIYFTDIFHNNGTLWKTDKTGNQLAVVLTQHHSHDIFMDDSGAIWGTDDDYISSTEENEIHLWKLSPKGHKKVIIPPTRAPGELGGAVFGIDASEQIYFIFDSQLFRRKADSAPELVLDHQFGHVTSLKVGPDGNIYLADNMPNRGRIYQVTPEGVLSDFGKFLKDAPPLDPPFPEPQFDLLFGMTFDEMGDLYVTNSGGRKLVKVTSPKAGGQIISAIYRAEAPWYPVGIALDGAEKYILEVAFEAEKGNFGPRIVHLDKFNQKTILINVEAYLQNNPQPAQAEYKKKIFLDIPKEWQLNLAMGILIGLVGLVIVIIQSRKRKKEDKNS